MAQTYRVPVQWTMWGTFTIEADSLEEAVKQALDNSDFPNNQEYVGDSFQVDNKEMIRDVNGASIFPTATSFTETDETYLQQL
ncbi:hypothetical protein [Hymenobacter siberiensis]|uniref:hypothetical protein n=1 Tax=Hymenobacter siberiensis TaxID=2848396 RepID=UPI001C1E3B6F|nr:hypothetical protein [Hymenobacter siberiensis]